MGTIALGINLEFVRHGRLSGHQHRASEEPALSSGGRRQPR